MLTLKKLTMNNFNFLLKFTIQEYGGDLFNYGEATDRKRAEILARKEITNLVKQGLDTPNQYIYRVKKEHETIGWLWYQMTDAGKTGFLLYIFINKEHRRKGYGEELLKLFEKEAEDRGADNLILYVFLENTPAVRMYKKNNYFIVKEAGFYDATKSTRYKMAKRLRE